jgi:hypothetical protein
MSARHVAGAATATASSITQMIDSSLRNATAPDSGTSATNATLSLPLRAIQLTVRAEKALLRKISALLFRVSGIQALTHAISDALGMGALGGPPGAAVGEAAAEGTGPQSWTGALLEALELGNIRSLGGMFNFLFSRWAFACLAMVWEF